MSSHPEIELDSNVSSLIQSLTFDNWFVQLAIISDAFREIGMEKEADRCDDLIVCKRRPSIDSIDGEYYGEYYWYSHHQAWRSEEGLVPASVVDHVDGLNGEKFTFAIQDQLIPYLSIPDELRLKRPD